MSLPAPFHLSLKPFLLGEKLDVGVDISDKHAVDFNEFLEEYHQYFPNSFDSNETIFSGYSIIRPDLSFYKTSDGLILTDRQQQPIGCYLWTSLTLCEDYQGYGLGRELVINRLLEDGENPVWNLDVPSYSTAGLSCHASAWRWIRNHHVYRKDTAYASPNHFSSRDRTGRPQALVHR